MKLNFKYSPRSKLIIRTISTILISFLIALNANLITINNKISWSSIHKNKEFWFLIIVIISSIIYEVKTYKKEKIVWQSWQSFNDAYFKAVYDSRQIDLAISQQNKAMIRGDLSTITFYDDFLNKIKKKMR